MTTATTTARPALTPRQAEVLRAIVRLTGERGSPPTIREVGAAFGWASPQAVVGHLRALAKKGYIDWSPRPHGDGCTTRGIVVPELRAALAAAAAEYLKGVA